MYFGAEIIESGDTNFYSGLLVQVDATRIITVELEGIEFCGLNLLRLSSAESPLNQNYISND